MQKKPQPNGDLNPKQRLTCSVGCCTAIQETRIPSEMYAGEHVSLMGNTHP